jgi:hypothetical protein
MSVGDELARFFMHYEFTGKHEMIDIPNGAVLGIADAIISSLGDLDDASREDADSFAKRYGTYTLQRIAIFEVESSQIGLTRGFELSDIDEVIKGVALILRMFATQERMGSNAGKQIYAKLEENGELGWWMESRQGA